jgi:adenylate cyclase class 2
MGDAGHDEVEIKLRVPDVKAMRRCLAKLGARGIRRVHERNVLFDTPEGALRRAGQLLRLRWSGDGAVLTFKSPLARRQGRERFKVRREVEFAVQAEAMRAMLAGAGLEEGFRYEKYRSSYRVPRAGKVKLELDETPIGGFVELEGEPPAIDALARRLGYRPQDYITANYLVLYAQHCRGRGRPVRHMVFSPPLRRKREARR